MKSILKVLLIAIVIVFGLALAKDLIAKAAIENGAQLVTGLGLKMDRFHLGILKGKVEINNLRLQNPRGYEEPSMMKMPRILVDIEPAAILKGKIHLEDMIIEMEEFYVVKNSQGELNLDTLKPVQKEGAEPQPEKKKKEAGAMPEMQIDHLHLKVGKVVFKDFSKGGEPSVKNFNINLDEEFENITDPNTLVRLIVAKTLLQTSIGNLIDFDLGGLNESVGEALASSKEMAMKAASEAQAKLGDAAGSAREAASKLAESAAVDKVEGLAGDVAGSAKDAASSAAGSVKDAAKDLAGLKDKVKIPFGKSGN